MTDADALAALIDEARLGGNWVRLSIQDRAGLPEPEVIGRVADAIGVTRPVSWREVPIRTDGRRVLAHAIGYGFVGWRLSREEVEALVDRVIAAVPGAVTAYTNLGRYAPDFAWMGYDPLSDWPDGIALILVGPALVGGIAIYGTD